MGYGFIKIRIFGSPDEFFYPDMVFSILGPDMILIKYSLFFSR